MKKEVFKYLNAVYKVSESTISRHLNIDLNMPYKRIGDSDSFVPHPWPKTVFQTALIEAAKSGGGRFGRFFVKIISISEKKSVYG